MDKSFNTLQILSNLKSDDPLTGSMTINGGVGIKKNINVGENINTGSLISRGDSIIMGDLTVYGITNIESIYKIIGSNLKWDKNMLPSEDLKYDLGSKDCRWDNGFINHIYNNTIRSNYIKSNNLEITKDVKLGYNNCNNYILNIENDVIINSNLIINNKKTKKILTIDTDNEEIIFTNTIINKNSLKTNDIFLSNYLSLEPQIVLTDNNSNIVFLWRSLIFIETKSQSNIMIKLDQSNINKKYLYFKLILMKNNGSITINFENQSVVLSNKFDKLELIYDNGFIQIN